MAAYLNEIQTRTGKDNLPDLLDAILQIEQRFVAIQPTHAKQQVFTKAHRASQFATFTTKEDREHHFDTSNQRHTNKQSGYGGSDWKVKTSGAELMASQH